MQTKTDAGATLKRWSVLLWLTTWVSASTPVQAVAQAPADASRADVRQVAVMEYRFERTRVEEARAWLQRHNCGHHIPVTRAGRVVGLKVYGIRRGSLPHQGGLRNGDIVTAINGVPLSSPESALRAYAELLQAARVTIEVERGEQTLALVWLTDQR